MMKKILMMLTALCLLLPTVEAQNKALEKARKKEYQRKLKEFKKDDWKVFGTARSFEVALLQHYDKLNNLGDNGTEIVGAASKFKSKNIGHQMAINNACMTYAQQAGSQLKGRIVSDMNANGTDGEGEFEKMYAAYERLVEKEIKGEMKETFSVIRDNGDGTFEMQSFFIVDENAASAARIRAIESAAKESTVAQKYAQKISDFVKEGVKN
jgi:hypothetical protein